MKIIDNFLDQETFSSLKEMLERYDFGWFLSQGVTDLSNPNKEHYNFVHLFYVNHKVNSKYFDSLKPILEKLNVKSLIRIKSNLYPKTSKIVQHDFHTDFPYSHKAALLMMNTNNGFTIMNDDKKVKTIENRMLLFDASKPHKSTTCTNEKYKINIIFNYF
jgi:hypothetical protein|tara:strand:- start:957 stop:1439 length:483 start_codon:yes stop_codon:yes gene_type:complete